MAIAVIAERREGHPRGDLSAGYHPTAGEFQSISANTGDAYQHQTNGQKRGGKIKHQSEISDVFKCIRGLIDVQYFSS